MKRQIVIFIIVVLGIFNYKFSFGSHPISIHEAQFPSLAPMLVQVQPSVVNISTMTKIKIQENPLMQDPFFRRFFNFPEERQSNSLGSGVIVDSKNGYIVTNHHVIDKAHEIKVTTQDGRELEAELVGSDAATDIAVIRVKEENLSAIKIGNSNTLKVGDFVVAIGSPFGLSQTVTSGIVSALGRSGLGLEGYEDFIQTDASINPGNSGGALVNLRGELIGINTAILSRGGGSVGIGLSIPVDMVSSLMDQIIKFGEVKRGLLGVVMQTLTPSLSDAFGISGKKGAVISQIIPGSSAEEEGLAEGDVITRFNDMPIENSIDLRNAVGLLRTGSKADVQFYRDGNLKQVTVKIKSLDGPIRAESWIIKRLNGARFKDSISKDKVKIGVEVTNIDPDSEAADSGLKVGDIIVSINRKTVGTLKDMEDIVKQSGKILLIKLIRDDRTLFLVIR